MAKRTKNRMRLTVKEEEIMNIFWRQGPLFVREILENYKDPKPHFNTLSTIVRGLEDKGFLGHTSFGNSYRYHPLISCEEYNKKALNSIVDKYFQNSYLGVVSSFIEEEHISLDELKKLIEQVEKSTK